MTTYVVVSATAHEFAEWCHQNHRNPRRVIAITRVDDCARLYGKRNLHIVRLDEWWRNMSVDDAAEIEGRLAFLEELVA